jgi:3-oxoacyl-[acyl-carrier protein] reductase
VGLFSFVLGGVKVSHLDMRSALVTGGAAGLARGVCLALARDGYDVHFTFRPQGTGPQETQRLIAAEGCTSHAHPVEFSGDAARVEEQLHVVVADISFGVLVHAVGPMTIQRFERSTLSDFEAMIEGNLRSAVLAAAAVLPQMRAAAFGRIVFFGMNGSNATLPARGLSLYAAAKSGLVSFARTLALEEGRHGVTVNVIQPGDIRDKEAPRAQTRRVAAQNAVRRAGSWEDVADAVRFLIREDADYITGAVLDVGGGLMGPYERKAT